MPSRPHFAYQTPSGFVDERAQYPFDQRQASSAVDLVLGQKILNQVLRLDEDSVFMWRGISWEFPTQTGFLWGHVAMRLRDAYGNYLSNDFIPILNYAQGYFVMQPWSGVEPPAGPTFVAPFEGGMGVAFSDELECPASSVLQVDILGLNNGEFVSNVGRFMARGVKRRPAGACVEQRG